ncbi:MAG: AAA family ATPase [Bacteroides sp.]|jgi:dephospho-CoA kinase|nr:AAA family ATPase [Bacteroides sp.]
MIIIGITGTLGAGKGTVVEYLTSYCGFVHFSVRAFITRELERRGMPVNRDTLTALANEMRAKNSPSYIIEELYEAAALEDKNCIIESIRTPGEVAALRSKPDFFLLAVDADPRIRFNRVRKRNSETDKVSFTTFINNEQREMHSEDPNKQNLAECIRQADFVIENNGSMEELHEKTEEFLKFITHRNH